CLPRLQCVHRIGSPTGPLAETWRRCALELATGFVSAFDCAENCPNLSQAAPFCLSRGDMLAPGRRGAFPQAPIVAQEPSREPALTSQTATEASVSRSPRTSQYRAAPRCT